MTDDFEPDWLSAPGATIAILLRKKNITVSEFAKTLKCSQDHAKALLSGRAVITGETARLLQEKLGGSADFWISREEFFRKDVARLQAKGRSEAAKLWLSELPLSDMEKYGWVKLGQSIESKVKACLQFFDVADVDTWRTKYSPVLSVVSFRTSLTYRSEPGAVLAWLRRGEMLSQKIDCKNWDLDKFKDSLNKIKTLTHIKEVKRLLPELQRICAECGVSLVVARAPKGCKASGATRFLSPDKAMILLSFRHLTDDHFWFTFFHEAAHLLLHSKNAIFIEDGSEVTEQEEAEANAFAADFLIPNDYKEKLGFKRIGKNDILRAAAKFGISRGIVVGQLQHMKLVDADKLNWMKHRFSWAEIQRATIHGKK
ncbi:MAG: ImmA/IrrE family metallo-endopeptidase [Xanthobacteraceae bacterium]|jgi:Zn-dependent peptidase ImmA (M78 family)/plasmid maintenance system antidote protein VapI|nr:ImmA/IrrE family metallo-endopeptidase [Xanthobacteraceae bacterium]